MPVSGEFTWTESADRIEVTVPLKGVSPKKVDVFTASTILKVSFPPFLVDLNLFHPIDVDKSKAILKEGTLKILLAKKDGQREFWGQLCFEGTKEEVKLRRQQALKEHNEKVKQQMEKVAEKKVEEERMTFQQHMALEQKERQRMDDVKAQEKKNAEEAMHKIFSELHSSGSSSSKPTRESHTKAVKAPHKSTEPAPNDTEPQDAIDEVPPIRTRIQATFRNTPRLFKTPSRESTAKQEQEFITQNRANLKNNALLNSDKSACDLDPSWLRTKGDEFKSRGDYSSAINAYSDALEIDGNMVDVLASRAACYLQLRDGTTVVKDCLRVLDMRDAVESLLKSKEAQMQFEKENLVRAGMGYCLNKEYSCGMQSFEEAKELDQIDKTIQHCINHLTILMKANEHKDEADNSFTKGDFATAISSYSKSLEIYPAFINALINRTAVHLAMKNSVGGIEDSTRALQLLSGGRKRVESNVLESLLFPDSATKRKWIVSLLHRRAAARRLDKDLSGSLKDLEEALQHAKRCSDIDTASLEKDIAAIGQELAI
jgi:dyslexia susceptibility 1 candidate gene 1 protein